MKKGSPILFLAMMVPEVLFGAETMTKIVHRDISTNYPASSFASKSTTLYRMGTKFGRTEEAPDPDMGIHGLFIVNEPDAWMINMMTKTGTHMVDRGPTFDFHAFIVTLPDRTMSQSDFRTFASSTVSKMEFGREMEFIKSRNARKSLIQVGARSCDRYELQVDDYGIELFTKAGTEVPYQVKILKGNKVICYIQYESYQTDLPFDSTLFKPPAGITLSEASH